MQYALYSPLYKIFVKIFSSSTQDKIDFHFISSVQKFSDFLGFHFEVVLRSIKPDPHFPHLRRMRFFVGLSFFLLFLVGPLTVVHDFYHGGFGGGGNLNDVQFLLLRDLEGFRNSNDTIIGAVVADRPDFRGGYLIIDADPLLSQMN